MISEYYQQISQELIEILCAQSVVDKITYEQVEIINYHYEHKCISYSDSR
jgi:hypothetical protein